MKNDGIYLQHILDAISKIETYISVGKKRFTAESHWHDAVIRQLEIKQNRGHPLEGTLSSYTA